LTTKDILQICEFQPSSDVWAFLFGTNQGSCRYIGMNIVKPEERTSSITVILRENAGSSPSNYIIELQQSGGEMDYVLPDEMTIPDDRDKPYTFVFFKHLHEKDQFIISIYYFKDGYTEAITTALDDLILSPQGDDMLSLKQAIDSLHPIPTCELVYRGQVYCTSETDYYPYAPIRDEFEVIEKDAFTYKTRE
jgi:hypothetical protein